MIDQDSTPVIASSPGIQTTHQLQTKLYMEDWIGWFNSQ